MLPQKDFTKVSPTKSVKTQEGSNVPWRVGELFQPGIEGIQSVSTEGLHGEKRNGRARGYLGRTAVDADGQKIEELKEGETVPFFFFFSSSSF